MKCTQRSSTALFSLLLVLALLLGACTAAPAAVPATGDAAAGGATAADQTKLRVMTFFAYDNPEVEQAVVDAFEAAHPEIDVELELTSYNDIFTKYQTQAAGGTAPDVISMNFENLRSFATKGAVAPLTEYIARDSYDTGIYYENTLDMHTVDGTVYGLPATFSDNVLYYNKDMFDGSLSRMWTATARPTPTATALPGIPCISSCGDPTSFRPKAPAH